MQERASIQYLILAETLQGLFQKKPIKAFTRNTNVKELIGRNCIKNGKHKQAKSAFTVGNCSQCLSKTGNLDWSQLTSPTAFINQQKRRKWKIYHKGNWKSEYVIYFMECTLCSKQYVGKAATAFNIRLNNHRKDTKNQNAILAFRHFQQQDHNFNSPTKFIIMDKLVSTSNSKQILSDRLIQRENLWVWKLKTLVP